MKDIIGDAIKDYWKGNYTDDLYTETNISSRDVLPLPYLFRSFDQMPGLEQVALHKCSGKVLDIGCGAGGHALYLQDKGLSVVAIDRSPGAVGVCQERGVKVVKNKALLDFTGDSFDTILLLMNGTGIFESVERSTDYLRHLRSLLSPGGQVILDSSDLIYMYDRSETGGVLVPADRYYGELTFTVEYRSGRSEPFPWLYLDKELLAKLATENGFNMEVLAEGDHFDYLARLTLADN